MLHLYENDDLLPVISDLVLDEELGYSLILSTLFIDDIYEYLKNYYNLSIREIKRDTETIWSVNQNTE